MKPLFVAVAMFSMALTIQSQTTSSGDTLQTEIGRSPQQRPADQNLLIVQAQKPNEIRRGNVTYSGILVESAKTRNPLQMINPAAPPQYGSPEDNVVRDPMTGNPSGLKLFAIQF